MGSSKKTARSRKPGPPQSSGVLAFQMRRAIEQKGFTNSEMAARMRTSRAALDRLLNPKNRSVTLLSMSRAAAVLDKDLRIELVDRPDGTDGEQAQVSA